MADTLDLGALRRMLGTLDALSESFERLDSPGPTERIPVVGKLHRIYLLCQEALDEARFEELRQLVGVKYLETGELSGHMARSTLATMRGYLHGCVQELEVMAQREANAHAYAAEKVREERPIGFRS